MEYKDYNFGKYKIRVNKKKLEEINKQIAPGKSWWALVGIFVFFFLPEIVAFFWGDEIYKYFQIKEANAIEPMQKFLYRQLESLGKNSLINITIGILFTIWFFKRRKK